MAREKKRRKVFSSRFYIYGIFYSVGGPSVNKNEKPRRDLEKEAENKKKKSGSTAATDFAFSPIEEKKGRNGNHSGEEKKKKKGDMAV